MQELIRLSERDAVSGSMWRRLAESFYARVAQDDRLYHLFPGKTLHCAVEELSAFLVQLFGGPPEDTQRRWWVSVRESHQRFRIRQEDRTAWLENMWMALDEWAVEPEIREAMREFFESSSG